MINSKDGKYKFHISYISHYYNLVNLFCDTPAIVQSLIRYLMKSVKEVTISNSVDLGGLFTKRLHNPREFYVMTEGEAGGISQAYRRLRGGGGGVKVYGVSVKLIVLFAMSTVKSVCL